jgi:hypothetical protein
MSNKQHNMAMAFIYMNWIFLEEYDIAPEEIADYMEQAWAKSFDGKLDRKKLLEAIERGRDIRATEPPDFWTAAIRIIRSRTEYF